MEGIGTAKVTENTYKYKDKELNEDLGLNWYDYGARWYDPILGRWWSGDPMNEASINISGYAYVSNNPINMIDPSGMVSQSIGADGLTDEEWIDATRPGQSSGKGDEYRKNHQAEEVDRASLKRDVDQALSSPGNKTHSYVLDSDTGRYIEISEPGGEGVDFLYYGTIHKNEAGDIVGVTYSRYITILLPIVYKQILNCGSGHSRFPGLDITYFPSTGLATPTEDPFTIWAGGAIKGGATAIGNIFAREAAQVESVNAEMTVYRVFGGDARAQGFSWTNIDPTSVKDFRNVAGLPSGGASGAVNTADFLVKGRVKVSDILRLVQRYR